MSKKRNGFMMNVLEKWSTCTHFVTVWKKLEGMVLEIAMLYIKLASTKIKLFMTKIQLHLDYYTMILI